MSTSSTVVKPSLMLLLTANVQEATLFEVQNRLDKTNQLISTRNSVAAKIADALRLQWLRELGSELKYFMKRIFLVNILTYRTVLSIQSLLPNDAERSMALLQEPMIFEDAIGRIAPVNLQFITTWEMFDSALELRFANVPGLWKVKWKEYVLEERATGRETLRIRPFDLSFRPGQRIDMSIIFQRFFETGTSSAAISCLGCHFPSDKPQGDVDILCDSHASGRHEYRPSPKKRKRAEDSDSPVHFKRVRLMSRQRRLRLEDQLGNRDHVFIGLK
ncbi:hypothetical protein AOQ84DRAFT_412323 [Glonium stellatum]|uniref:Ubiquitin-like domain-containing protein n=1 Tax=Glonium stellatum TaxID=574774 RepID=A0A8E2EWM4_9PEZI|nr:hypothetical protein AOQ84DRAFT_412323 [Glonium stellatum]